MFYSDKYSLADYVGFVDTDTTFINRDTHDDLFQGDKPKMYAVYGRPVNDFWVHCPASTFYALGKKEPFKGMSYFPVVGVSQILNVIKKDFNNELSSKQEIHNALAAARLKMLNGLSPIQKLLELLHEGSYMFSYEVSDNGAIKYLFFPI
jgi:hypothetical protein